MFLDQTVLDFCSLIINSCLPLTKDILFLTIGCDLEKCFFYFTYVGIILQVNGLIINQGKCRNRVGRLKPEGRINENQVVYNCVFADQFPQKSNCILLRGQSKMTSRSEGGHRFLWQNMTEEGGGRHKCDVTLRCRHTE